MESAKEKTVSEPRKKPKPRAVPENKKTSRVLAQENEEEREEKKVVKEECKTWKEQKEKSQQIIVNLKTHLTDSAADAQTAVDAKVVQKRTQLNKEKEIREKLLENDVKSSQEKFDELEGGWLLVSQKGIPPELQETLNKQQELCAVLIQDKNKLINELQQELKLRDDCYVKDLRKNTEEIGLTIEKMEDQAKILRQTYREQMAQTERVHQQELKSLLSEDITKWEEDLKEQWDKELERVSERRKTMEEYEEKIHELRLKNAYIVEALDLKEKAEEQDQVRNHEKKKIISVQEEIQLSIIKDMAKQTKITLAKLKRNVFRSENKVQKMKEKDMKAKQELEKQNYVLSVDLKRQIQSYERIKAQIKHFEVADAKQYEEMRLMMDANLKQLAERALLIDSVISKEILGLPWEKPPLPSLDLPHPSCSQELAGTSGSDPDWETQKKVKELLCQETDFLMETNLLKVLAHLENEEQTNVKLATLLYSLGLDDSDLPELINFFLKYEQQQREQNMDDCAESSDLAEAAESRATTEPINPNHVLPALKSFLKHKTKRRSSTPKDSSENEAYWESFGNIVSEEKLQLWDTAEKQLRECHSVLRDISDLTQETDRLKQQNSELKMQLQQLLASRK